MADKKDGVLSMKEIDDLLTMPGVVGKNEEKTDEEYEEEFKRHCNFSHPKFLTNAQIESFESLAEDFCNSLQETFEQKLNKKSVFSVASIEQVSYEEFCSDLPIFSAVLLFKDLLGRKVLLQIPRKLFPEPFETKFAKEFVNRLFKKTLNETLFKKVRLKFSCKEAEKYYRDLREKPLEEMGISIIIKSEIEGVEIDYDDDERNFFVWIPKSYFIGREKFFLNEKAMKEKLMRTKKLKKTKTKKLGDAQLEVRVVLGETVMTIKELEGLKEESVVELDKFCGESVDIEVDGAVIARGEVVKLDKKLGVEVTEVF